MDGTAGGTPPKLDMALFGQTMLDAAATAGIGVTISLLEDGGARNIFANRAAAEIFGVSVRELLVFDPMSFIAPEDHAYVRERLGARSRGDPGQSRYELHIVRPDGRRSIEVTTSGISIDGHPAVVAFLVDISERKNAEKARQQTEARFRELIEHAPEPIAIHRGGKLVYGNRALCAALGFPNSDALAQVTLRDLIAPEQIPTLDTRVKAITGDGTRLPSQMYRVHRPDGATAILEGNSVPFEWEGKASILSMFHDVTERVALQTRLLQADRLAALGTMAAGVAHEINNPLSYVMLNLDGVARKLAGGASDALSLDSLGEMLGEARRGAERVATIVRELRAVSRADAETRAAVDLAHVVRSAIRIGAHEIRHRARLSTSFSPVPAVWADAGRLEQVVLNLLLNAAQAMPEGRAQTNEIRVAVHPGQDATAVLEVADNGQGIPAEVVPRIFDPFFTTKPPGVGTGLGLSICHGIVTSLGGQITVQSEPGRGTVFRVALPTTAEHGAGQSAQPVRPEAEAPGQRRARVLIVDDEVHIANTMRLLLSDDHDVVATTSAGDALGALRGQQFDVIFCDLMMPGMSGFEFFERLREEQPGVERRVVFMTGGAATPTASAFLASVDNRRVEKPFSLGLLDFIVRQAKESPP
jgi:PAS domain S-box-containing protein